MEGAPSSISTPWVGSCGTASGPPEWLHSLIGQLCFPLVESCFFTPDPTQSEGNSALVAGRSLDGYSLEVRGVYIFTLGLLGARGALRLGELSSLCQCGYKKMPCVQGHANTDMHTHHAWACLFTPKHFEQAMGAHAWNSLFLGHLFWPQDEARCFVYFQAS